MAIYDYRLAAGHNVALASMRNVEDFAEIAIAPKTQPVNEYPIRIATLDGKEHGDGQLNHVWEFNILPVTALDFIQDTFLVATDVSTAVTVNTRLHDQATYKRYNAYLVRPVPGEDYRYDRKYVFDLRLRFRNLIAL